MRANHRCPKGVATQANTAQADLARHLLVAQLALRPGTAGAAGGVQLAHARLRVLRCACLRVGMRLGLGLGLGLQLLLHQQLLLEQERLLDMGRHLLHRLRVAHLCQRSWPQSCHEALESSWLASARLILPAPRTGVGGSGEDSAAAGVRWQGSAGCQGLRTCLQVRPPGAGQWWVRSSVALPLPLPLLLPLPQLGPVRRVLCCGGQHLGREGRRGLRLALLLLHRLLQPAGQQ